MEFPNYFELIRLTWRQYVSRFDIILGLTVLVALPIHVVVNVALPEIPSLTGATTLEQLYQALTTDSAVWQMLFWNVLSSLGLLYLTTCLIVTLRASYQRKSLRLSSILQVAWHYYMPVMVVSVLAGTATVLGLIFFIIPGFIVSTYLSLAPAVVVWENLPPLAALRRSVQLVRGHAGVVFMYILMTQLLLALLIWMLISVVPATFPFEVFSLTVGSLITAFSVFFESVLFTACATWFGAKELMQVAATDKPPVHADAATVTGVSADKTKKN